jgi:hypothetical protein
LLAACIAPFARFLSANKITMLVSVFLVFILIAFYN